jgi:uncharacterized protein (TIGR03435 family)
MIIFRAAPKRLSILGVALAFSTMPLVEAQAGGEASQFEVASIRLNTEDRALGKCTGGPGTQDPTLWICDSTNRTALIRAALGAEVYQFLPPDSMHEPFFSISARLPANATKDQFHDMLRNLLEERFHLTWHWRESDASVYRLVRDPDGVRLHESAPDAEPAVVDYGFPPGTVMGKDRYPILAEGVSGLIGWGNHNRWRMSNVTTADIAWVLRWEFRTDVIDETGLTGHYDVDLRWETPPMEYFPSAPPYDGPDAKTEFRNKLGLRLEPAKGKIRTLVVDHIDRVPTEN